MMDYGKIPTEKLNPRAKGLERMSLAEALRLMDLEDARMLAAVRRAGPAVEKAVDAIVRRMSMGGRLFFAGAGTSGRLGVLEAAECPPTFGTSPSLVQAFMAGGASSVFRSKEGAEDKGETASSIVRRKVRRGDVVVGVTASGVTAFALSALKAARRKGAATVLVTCNPRASRGAADVLVAADSGAEVIAGSTRLKAGTATKIILNRLTTLAMVRLGRTRGPFMVNLLPRSKKLVARARRLVKLGLRKGVYAFLLAAACALPASAAVYTGLDVLERHRFAELQGKRVGVICNHTAVNARGRHLVDLLRTAKDVQLKAIFAPEHGFAGTLEHGRKVENGRTADGIPIISLYGADQRPRQEDLKDLDVLVFDIQDAGARFYTYITTLGYALEAAAEAHIEMMVLDRPNPARGDVVEGEILSPAVRHFTAYYSIPVRHGLTVAEIARWHNQTVNWPRLTLIRMEGWRRDMTWKESGLRFCPPSPNIRRPLTALLYPGIGAFEATNVAVGRGTPTPFELFGAPWLNGKALSDKLNAASLPGVRFEPVDFTPSSDRYAGERCSGVRIAVTDESAARPVEVFLRAAFLIRDAHPYHFELRWPEMPRVTGTDKFERAYKSAQPVDGLLAAARADAASFLEKRRSILLYE